MRKLSRGFTLIELLVVIAIIAILASIVLASLNSARVKSRDARRMADLKQVENALELYNNDNQSYPAVTTYSALSSYLVPNYISTLPVDPQGASSTYAYAYQALASSATNAATCSSAPCGSYVLRVQLENDNTTVLDQSADSGLTLGSTVTTSCDHSTSYYYCVRP